MGDESRDLVHGARPRVHSQTWVREKDRARDVNRLLVIDDISRSSYLGWHRGSGRVHARFGHLCSRVIHDLGQLSTVCPHIPYLGPDSSSNPDVGVDEDLECKTKRPPSRTTSSQSEIGPCANG